MKSGDESGVGIPVTEADISAAFDFLDVEKRGVIKASTLRKRLGAFHRNITVRVRYGGLSLTKRHYGYRETMAISPLLLEQQHAAAPSQQEQCACCMDYHE